MFAELGHWVAVKDGNAAVWPLFQRHYSAHNIKRNGNDRRFVAPGEKLVLATVAYDALFAWRKAVYRQIGIECTIFRNESNVWK